MNNVEASRVMAVLGELLADLRRISLVTAGSLESAEELEEVMGPELSQILMEHRGSAAKVQTDGHDCLAPTTLSICRKLRKNPQLENQLGHLFQEERSAGMIELIAILEKVKARTYKCLTTTMEEENSEKDHFEEVCRREEKAGKERQTLEQQLRVERRERSKQVNYMMGMESRATSELEQLRSTSVKMITSLQTDAKSTLESDLQAYQERDVFLKAEVDKLRAELAMVEAENRDEEMHLRKKKTKSEQDVDGCLALYDSEMSQKEKAFQEELAVYEEVKSTLSEDEAAWRELRAEADAAEEKAKKKADERARRDEKEKRVNKAASVIQKAWRDLHNSKPPGGEDTGKKKKGKGKGGKGKKKK
eukprot:CAMPEP_0196587282 /NCGR_PEP_ID=MMETSP1081-20130531/57000_1 /TAXON_ID=36882 /ORGANISM="Pyramimonas amylifera, Strain CCMP720" /LENGTH=362 /DNA_ID=CAMNT_0041909425 /DNA_START=137 /DNA_END=1225 /DNA_ORIENTATION=-